MATRPRVPLILTCYGFWLPNDPRGSGSHEVWSDNLKPFGPATHVESEHSVAHRAHDRNIRKQAKLALRRPPVSLTGIQANRIANAFGDWFHKHEIPSWACAVLPEHAHFTFARTGDFTSETVATALKAKATKALLDAGIHPFQDHRARGEPVPKMWARDCRHVFIFDNAGIRSRIRYVEENPVKAGLKLQHWSFVTPFTGLLPTA